MNKQIVIDADIDISTPSGIMKVAGEGSKIFLSLPSGSFMVSVFSRFPFPRRKALTSLTSILERAGITLDILIRGHRVASMGAGVPRLNWLRLFGLRGLQLHLGSIILSAVR